MPARRRRPRMEPPPQEQPAGRKSNRYGRTYHRISDDSLSSFYGHRTWEEARDEAASMVLDRDLDAIWIRADNVIIWWTGRDPRVPWEL